MITPKSPRTIFGIDPGARVVGYAFIRAKTALPLVPADFAVIEAGALRVDQRLPHAERLGLLHGAVHELAARHAPDVCVLERAFCDKNVASALKLGEARGAFIAACGRLGIPIGEITPAEVKKTITGNGRAEKEEISLALKALTGFDRGELPHDVTDALALSLCFGLGLTGREARAAAAEAQP
jgi:crossover junction endodeoxyribonuclease RuvC